MEQSDLIALPCSPVSPIARRNCSLVLFLLFFFIFFFFQFSLFVQKKNQAPIAPCRSHTPYYITHHPIQTWFLNSLPSSFSLLHFLFDPAPLLLPSFRALAHTHAHTRTHNHARNDKPPAHRLFFPAGFLFFSVVAIGGYLPACLPTCLPACLPACLLDVRVACPPRELVSTILRGTTSPPSVPTYLPTYPIRLPALRPRLAFVTRSAMRRGV
ncbi:hypothetical protein B0T26DRAFT_272118 [Lasiosphaeria miniovina]|uniref:Uncharacterized protein n=1 Tax=Lasiosphaeria miniovina TaxID=1954250 RepID=A0AA40AJE2_9PEZI|nr:uncharacterized protein B0T26DRAFT_272118 [Lasiosphaeria miniovina]KAK0716963.1 hypothetical protein B0T26DRAFT_272118 [Lasiosphaeria miniovina]